jgi:hypothetical protein
MKREIITITDEGSIVAPENLNKVRITIVEIADLFGIYYQTTKRHIRAIEKAGIADGDYKMTCVVEGVTAYPIYYGLDMITVLAFRVRSWQADTFRRWLMERVTQPTLPPISVFVPVRERTIPN